MTNRHRAALFLLLLLALLPVFYRGARAQEDAPVQRLDGRIEPGNISLYLLSDLQAGQTLYAHASNTSGNLDPILGVIAGDVDTEQLVADYSAAVAQAVASGEDLLPAINRLRDEFMLAWDDDGGGGLTAALPFQVPEDGDYLLLVSGTLASLGYATSGDFELLVGLNEPAVLEGTAEPTGDIIAVLDRDATPPQVGVQVINGSLVNERPSTTLTLEDFLEGDVLTVYLEAPNRDWQPRLLLSNFAGKPLAEGRTDPQTGVVTLEYTFPADARQTELQLFAAGGENTIAGDYRLLLGANSPEVLNGEAQESGRRVAALPLDVEVGLRLEQIIAVNQNDEFFHAAAVIRMEWNDPKLAFNPEDCDCDTLVFNGSAIDSFFADPARQFPLFTIPNQQGNRWIQNRDFTLTANGDATYFERFTTDFQVDFDYSQFPFDTETFFIRVDSILPEEDVAFRVLPGYSIISPDNGEDEFILSEVTAEILRLPDFQNKLHTRYQFSFSAPRHLEYYFFQIFVPILLIIAVSWFTFFLKDYMRRIEVASGNLLLFIAFSFSLSDNYPRLGYLTFLDAIMAAMFVINALVIIYNVWMRRMEMNGRDAQVKRIDDAMDWIYPFIYIGALALMYIWFF